LSARVLDGRALAAELRADVAARASAFQAAQGRPVGLAALLVGDDPASEAYAKAKGRAAEKCGLAFRLERLPAAAGTAAAVDRLRSLAEDPGVDALVLELPLPAGYDQRAIEAAIEAAADADGVTVLSQGRLLAGQPGPRPATALAVLDLARLALPDLRGVEAVVVGRSAVVGKPAALLLLAEHATVTLAHSRTRDLAAVTRRADVLVAAVGRAGLIGAGHVRPGAVVIDVGTNVVPGPDGERLVGDVDAAAVAAVAGALTPVPGGVGPVTTARLLANAVALAEARHGPAPAG
jgi:methylenetetrahydrofolate dehydrogenase (NADP+)/methenyltetrahydrofolate cyclohydrolase